MVTRRRVLQGAAALPLMATGLAARAAPADGASAIVLAAPSAYDGYYRELRREILEFDAEFLGSAGAREPVLLLADRKTRSELGDRVPSRRIISEEVGDIWLVDFAPVQADGNLVKFLYRPNYLEASTARWIDGWFRRWMRKTGIESTALDIVLDGGNVVYDGEGQAIITEQLYVDNGSHDPEELRNLIRRALSLDRLAVIPRAPNDITGHADGMVKWLRPDLLAVSAYDEPLRSQVLAALGRDLPGVELIEVPYAPTGGAWRGWPSAGGIYVNALSTRRGFYLPVFGLPADDEAIETFGRLAPQPVVAVDSSQVAIMGGAVHCLSWYVTGEPAARLLATVD